MNTIDINTLDFTNAPAGFDRTDSLMNILIADIDDDKKAIIGFDIDTQKSSIAVGNPTTGKWADSADPQDWPALDRLFGRKNWQSFLRNHEQESRDMLNADDLAELEAEHGRPLTDEQKKQILAIADDGTDIDTAIAQVIEVEATVQIDAGQVPITDENGDYTGEQRHFDFVTFTTADGEQLEKPLPGGGIEQGVYVESCEDPEPYDIAAEQWLAGIPGIWTAGTWN